MELRDIEIFLTLAEELHFGRTAERLHLSQARVSQSISRQERRLGGALFDRSTRTVTLTPLGQRLRDDLHPGYGLIRKALTRAAETARGCSGTVRLGAMGALPPNWPGWSRSSAPATPSAVWSSWSTTSAIPSPGYGPAR